VLIGAPTLSILGWRYARLGADAAAKTSFLNEHTRRLKRELAQYELAVDSATLLSPVTSDPMLRGIQRLQAALAALPDPARGTADQVRAYTVLALAEDRLGRSDEALRDFLSALALGSRDASDTPGGPELSRERAACGVAYANVLRRQGRWKEAEYHFRLALPIIHRAASGPGATSRSRAQLAEALNDYGKLLLQRGRGEEARDLYLRARDLRQGLLREDPAALPAQRDVAASINNLGFLELTSRRHPEARTAFREAVALYRTLRAALPVSLGVAQEYVECLHNLALAERHLNDSAAAEDAARSAIAVLEPILRAHPDLVAFRADLALAYDDLGIVLVKAGHQKDALIALQSALEHGEEAHRRNPAAYGRLLEVIRSNWQTVLRPRREPPARQDPP
jgi:tetratricopeptide (TPR) repeat protein